MKSLPEKLKEVDACDIGLAKKERIKAHIRFCHKFKIDYELKALLKLSRDEIRDLKYGYGMLRKRR